MKIPYDVFNDIINVSDCSTIINLYYTDKTIKNLCLKHPFAKVLLNFSKNPYFDLNAKSDILDDFLNNLSGNDKDMLRDIQLTFGSCLSGKNILGKNIVLYGYNNGKTTFVKLIREIFGKFYLCAPTCEYIEKFRKNEYIVNLRDPYGEVNNLMPNDKYTIILEDCPIIYVNSQFKHIMFRTCYVSNPINLYHKKQNFYMVDILLQPKNLSSLLNFLLIGCKDLLINHKF